MPSQKQVRWSELRVGITVIFASITLAILIFLMTATTGIFTPKIYLKTYLDNAEGLRVGAPVRLQGVDVGNVTAVTVVSHKPLTPVEITMKVTTRYENMLRKDTTAELSTAGVLGEVFIDLNSALAREGRAADGDVLKAKEKPDLQDVIRASQTSLENVNVLVRRMDRIVGAIERGEGSIGKLIYDPTLFNKLNATLNEVQGVVNAVSKGKGTIGKLVMDDELYRKANASVDKLTKIVDDIEAGKGTLGKFVKDPALYDNANETVRQAKVLMEDVNHGKGALGKFAKDEAFAAKLDNTMTRISNLADRLDSGQGTLGLLFRNPSVYNNADAMLTETRSLVKAVRENPKKYLTIHFKVF
jgi:phospholipid/cholesterol/gamma-HCH transport system substrate-binding protein